MSVVRFVHTDALRLGSPLAGISDGPDWLRKAAASAVRTAVTNVIEAAIAGRCHFLLIAGRLCESPQDLDLAINWLRTSVAALHEHEIRLVLAGHSPSDAALLSGLDAILLGPDQRLDVRFEHADRPQLSVSSTTTPARPGSLGIQFTAGPLSRPLADLAYVAAPGVYPSSASSADGTTAAHDRLLRVSAGCPQAIMPSERGTFGCQLVEADLMRSSLTARFCATDVIRYSQSLLNCLPGTPIERVSELLCERSRAIASGGRCTTIVEWIIDGEIAWPAARRELLTESDLLHELRANLNAGHSGAWPGRIRFADGSSIIVAEEAALAERELATVIRERWQRLSSPPLRSGPGIPAGCGSESLTSLSLLRRAALSEIRRHGEPC